LSPPAIVAVPDDISVRVPTVLPESVKLFPPTAAVVIQAGILNVNPLLADE